MLKFIHNENISVGWAVIAELIVHGLFAFGAFLFGQFLGTLILGSGGADIGAYGLAIFVFMAAMQAFVLGEYLKDHVKAFERTSKGDGTYHKSYTSLRRIVAGIELSSLFFRFLAVIAKDPHSALAWLQAGATVIFGVLALWYAYSLAKVIHASVNRPVEYDVQQTRNHMTRSLVEEALKYEDSMTTAEKARILAGDYSAVDDVRVRMNRHNDRMEDEQYQRERQRKEREQQEDEDFKSNRGFISAILSPFVPAQANKAGRLSDPRMNSPLTGPGQNENGYDLNGHRTTLH